VCEHSRKNYCQLDSVRRFLVVTLFEHFAGLLEYFDGVIALVLVVLFNTLSDVQFGGREFPRVL
jgi:hypothetical protein